MRRVLTLLAVLATLFLAIAYSPSTVAAAPQGYSLLDGARQGNYLKLGSRGPAVAALQRALSQAGFLLVPDGAFGPLTLAAVQAFQHREGLAVDGIVGPQTVSALDRVLGVSGGGGTSTSNPNPGTSNPGTSNPNPQPGTLPSRPAGAMTGSQFIAWTTGWSTAQREAAILQEFLSGNIPDFLRQLQPVTVSSGGHSATFYVMPDYLAIGSDSDYVRMPMGSRTAQAIADAWGFNLPTRRMVDRIWQAAPSKIAPRPMNPTAAMRSNAYFAAHNQTIEGQLAAIGHVPGTLVAGHKKDVVISNLLQWRPDHVAIYGWHLLNGQPIQPLSTVHIHWYADYSHGIRLVDDTVYVDGLPMAIADVLADPNLSSLLSDEGVMTSARVP